VPCYLLIVSKQRRKTLGLPDRTLGDRATSKQQRNELTPKLPGSGGWVGGRSVLRYLHQEILPHMPHARLIELTRSDQTALCKLSSKTRIHQSRCNASVNVAGSLGGTKSRYFPPSSTSEGTDRQSVATTGTPHISASARTNPKPSNSEDNANTELLPNYWTVSVVDYLQTFEVQTAIELLEWR